MRRGYQPTQRCVKCNHRYRRTTAESVAQPCIVEGCGGKVVEVEPRDHLRGEANGASKVKRERRRIAASKAASPPTEAESWDAVVLRLRANTDAVRPRLRGAS